MIYIRSLPIPCFLISQILGLSLVKKNSVPSITIAIDILFGKQFSVFLLLAICKAARVLCRQCYPNSGLLKSVSGFERSILEAATDNCLTLMDKSQHLGS